MENNLSEILNIPVGKITPSAVDALVSLKIHDAGIKNLTGMEFFKALEVLDLDSNNVYSITPLKELYSLTHLRLAHSGHISDLTDLANLTNLSVINLDYNLIEDISPLVGIGLSQGDTVSLLGNILNPASIDTIIPYLENRGVIVIYDEK